MNTTEEIWKPIPKYADVYLVSNFGRVKSYSFQSKKGRILKPQINECGYLRVGLYKDGKIKNHSIHRLVCMNFHDNPENKPQVNHKDGNKANNNADNLEWSTCSENMRHSFDNGLQVSVSKITPEDAKNIYNMWSNKGLTYSEIAFKFNVSDDIIARVIRKDRWNKVNGKNAAIHSAWSFCHTCDKHFSNKGINSHKLNHRKNMTDCKITFGRGETKTFLFSTALSLTK